MRKTNLLRRTTRAGQHWGNVTLVEIRRVPLYETDAQGNQYMADTHGGPWTWKLECDCGHQWEILEVDFPGKRRLRSCSRPECQYGTKKREKAFKAHGISISIYADSDNFEGLNRYAQAHKLNFSQAANEVWRRGFLAEVMELLP